jgi:hypothetical protein
MGGDEAWRVAAQVSDSLLTQQQHLLDLRMLQSSIPLLSS